MSDSREGENHWTHRMPERIWWRGERHHASKLTSENVTAIREATPTGEEEAMSKLILTVGLPRSGKTTWARQQGHPIVNPDSIRLALHGQRFYGPAEPFVWAAAYMMVDALFRAGHDTVVVDATNVSAKRRDEWLRRYPDAEFKLIDTSPQICLERAAAEGDKYIAPVIERMAAEWDLPRPAHWSQS
jgi:predicted kinase